jgi:hypothetical protein
MNIKNKRGKKMKKETDNLISLRIKDVNLDEKTREEYSKISRRVMKTLDEDRPFLEEQHRKEQEKYVKIRQIVEEEMKELMEQMKELNENVIN